MYRNLWKIISILILLLRILAITSVHLQLELPQPTGPRPERLFLIIWMARASRTECWHGTLDLFSCLGGILAGLTGYFIHPIRNAEDILSDHDALAIAESAWRTAPDRISNPALCVTTPQKNSPCLGLSCNIRCVMLI